MLDHALNIFLVLPTTGVATPSGSCQHQRVFHAVISHLFSGLIIKRLPVAVTKINRQLVIARRQFFFHIGDNFPVQRIDGADTTEVVVMNRHFI